jgi:hypothetical protein
MKGPGLLKKGSKSRAAFPCLISSPLIDRNKNLIFIRIIVTIVGKRLGGYFGIVG